MSFARLSVVAAAVLAAASAAPPVWGTAGLLEHIQPPPPDTFWPQFPTWHKAATEGGALFVAGNDPFNGGAATLFGFDTSTLNWTQYAPGPALSASDLIAHGGSIWAIGGSDDTQSSLIMRHDISAGAGITWEAFPLNHSIESHDGHRLVEFGGIVYMLFGLDCPPAPASCVWSNAVWALDVGALRTNNGSWVKIIGINTPGMPSARGAFSLDVYGHNLVVFGGLTRAEAQRNQFQGCQSPGANCRVFNDMYMWSPGLPLSPLDGNRCGGTACGWRVVQPAGAAPPPRYGHATGVLSDNLYVFGGGDGTGLFLSDAWVYNILAQTWTPLTLVGGSITLPTQTWMPAGVVIGHRFYIHGTGDAGGNAIFRFTPMAPDVPPPSPVAVESPGVVAGLVLSTLIALVTLVAVSYDLSTRHCRRGVAALPSMGVPSGLGDVYESVPSGGA